MNSLGNAIEQQGQEMVGWHTYAVYYIYCILPFYYLSFIAGIKRCDSCCGITLVKALINTL